MFPPFVLCLTTLDRLLSHMASASEKGVLQDAWAEPSYFSEYKIKGQIGSGTTAVVRRATRLTDGREVALKCIKTSDDELQQFTREE